MIQKKVYCPLECAVGIECLVLFSLCSKLAIKCKNALMKIIIFKTKASNANIDHYSDQKRFSGNCRYASSDQ